MLTMPASMAQTTVTSSGRTGEAACLDKSQVNAGNLPITTLSTTSITFTVPQITWNQYVGRLGDRPAPAQATRYSRVLNARTNSIVGQSASGLSSGAVASSFNRNQGGLSAKTLYYADVLVTSAGLPTQVFARRCFMTGGTYTISANPIASGPTQGSTGCFTISPLTVHDVRNCWCGRRNNLPLFSSAQGNTDWHNMWGCR